MAMRVLKNYLIIPYFAFLLLCCITSLSVSIYYALTPSIVVSSVVLALLIVIGLSTFVLSLVTISNKGIKITYFKRMITEINWCDVVEVYFEKPLYHPNICFKTNKQGDREILIVFNINMRILRYIIKVCSNEEIKNKIIVLSDKENRRRFMIH